MRRVLSISAIAFGALAFVGVVGYFALFYSGPGRAFLAAQIETQIENVLGGTAQIGALRGAPPGRVILDRIILTDEAGPWLTAEYIEVVWRPLRLLGGEINIAALDVSNSVLLREAPSNGEGGDENERLSLRFPDNLPDIRIEDIALTNFRSELAAAHTRLDGAGAIQMGGKHLTAALAVTSENDRDYLDLKIDRMADEERLTIDALLMSGEDGVISRLANLGGPLTVQIQSDSPSSAAVVFLEGEIGAYGTIDARLEGDVDDLTAIELAGTFAPGPRLNRIEELSRPLDFHARLEEQGRGAALHIAELTSAVGTLQGVVEWANSRAVSDRLSATFSAALAADYRPEIQAYAGETVALTGELRRRREDYALEATATSDRLEAQISEGATDLDQFLRGHLTAVLWANDSAPWRAAQMELSGRLDMDFAERTALHDFTLRREDGSSAAGEASFGFSDEAIEFDGDIRAAPALIAAFTNAATPADFIDASIEMAGPLDRFTLNAEIDAPIIRMGNAETLPLDIEIALAGLPALPAGNISARARGGAPGRLNATLRSSQDGRIALTSLNYDGENFTLAGNGAFTPQTQLLELDLDYNGAAGAEPWPGISLEGGVSVEGKLARISGQSDFKITAPSLRYNDFSLEGLAATAQGPPRAINTELAATRFTAAQFIAEDMGLTARVNLREGVQASLSALSGVAADTTFSLREPASVTLDDGVAVERLRLNWGRGGEIALDGAFDSARWRASLGLVDADVPGADSRVTAHLDLDTDRDTPARGVFQLRSLLTQTQEARLSGDFIWNGETIILSSAQDGDALDMRVILPAKLVRAPAIRVETDGAFDGYMRYDGDIALIAAYLPPELQTLEGAFAADFEFSGTLDAPVIAGHARIDDGAYTELQTGFSLTGLHARADASYGDGQSVIRFLGGAQGSAPAEQDSITLTGEMMLGDTSNLALSVALNRVALSADPIAHLVASGRVDLAGPLDSLAAKGKITIEELNAEIVTPENTGLVPIEVAGYDSRGLAPSSGQLRPDSTLDYDIALLARDRIFIRGRGLESEWSADVAIVNENDGPMIVGEMRLRRGALDFSGRRFDLTRGAISFDRLSPNNPRLDIRAEYNAGDGVTAIIAFSGRTEAPQVALSSTPSLPSEDVMALVLFGKPANELTAIESLQAAQALAALGGVGLFGSGGDIASTLRQAVGLDLLNVDIDPENGGGSLTVGKYVADGVFVSATQDAKGESGSVHVEYEITNNISVETEIEQTGDQTVSANWKRDF